MYLTAVDERGEENHATSSCLHFFLLSIAPANALRIFTLTDGANRLDFCVETQGSGEGTIGTRMKIQRCRPNGNRQWRWDSKGNLYTLGNNGDILCLDVAGGVARAGNYVQLWGCNGTSAQRFQFGGGEVRFNYSNMCLDVPGNSKRNDTPLQIWTCNGTAAQKWNLE